MLILSHGHSNFFLGKLNPGFELPERGLVFALVGWGRKFVR